MVAVQAAAEGGRATGQVQALEQLAQLQRRFQGVHVAAVGDDAAFEQLAVAGQHDAPFAGRDIGDLAVFETVVVERVEAAHAQQAGEAAQVGVGDEA
ncbi:hypothetical protein D3C78_1582860 [compost metagenome]